MKKEQIIAFLKAPFSHSFIISYLFNFFLFLSVPLLSRLIGVLFKNLDTLSHLSKNELSVFVIRQLKQHVTVFDVVTAVIAIALTYLLLSASALVVSHKMAVRKKGVFDAEKVSFTFSEVLLALPKFLGAVLLSSVTFFVVMGGVVFISIFAIAGGMLVSKVLGILLVLLSIFASVYALYKCICYLLTFNFLFHKELKVSDFFKYKKVCSFFKAHQKKIFIGWLLSFVIGQVASTLQSSIGLTVFEKILVTGGLFNAVHLPTAIPVVIGIMICGLFVTYITLLQAVVFGKLVLWVSKK